jgi:hypothetical protein
MSRALDPVGALAGGVLIARTADPALADSGWAADSVGSLIGTGDGRGAAATLIVVSLALIVLASVLTRARAMRALDAPAPEAAERVDTLALAAA